MVSERTRASRTSPAGVTRNPSESRPATGRPVASGRMASDRESMRGTSSSGSSAPSTKGRGETNHPWTTTRPSRGSSVPRTVRTACGMRGSKVDEPVEARLHDPEEFRPLGLAGGPERSPPVEHLVPQDLGLAAPEAPPLPSGQGVDEGPRAVGQVSVQFLPAALHVDGEPGRGDVVAAQGPPAPPDQARMETFVDVPGKEGPGGRPERRVLPGNVPEVPDEAVARGDARIAEPGVEMGPEGATLGGESIDDGERADQSRRA